MEGELYKLIGGRIKNARERLGMSQEELARFMGYTSAATISHFETALRKISISDLHQVAEILGVRLDYLYSGDDVSPGMQRFRLRASGVKPSAQEAVASFLAFAQRRGITPSHFDQEIRALSAGIAAKRILSSAQITAPPVSPDEVAKYLGIPLFRWDFPDEVSGVFACEGEAVCIGINQSHSYVRQRFSVAHELGHFVFHEGQDLFLDITEMEFAVVSDEQQRLEKKANQFAADLLMPKSWIERDYREYGIDGVSALTQLYEVSEQALWFRLINLKLVDSSADQ